MQEKTLCLDGMWTLYLAPHCAVRTMEHLPCTAKELNDAGLETLGGCVPGNFEIDLMREGRLPDLFFDENTLLAQELENRHLWYVRSFPWNGGEARLRFEGIDTVAEIYVNGQKIGNADNMFVAHTFDVSLYSGENEICVHILPAVIAARDRVLEPAVTQALTYNFGSLTIRKAAHMYGWDIFPRIVSAGIWKSVYVEKIREEKIEEIYLYTARQSEKEAALHLYYRTSVTGDFSREYTLSVTGVCEDSRFTHVVRLWHTEGTGRIDVPNPKLWWPRDLGNPALYDITAELRHGDETIDVFHTTLGIRTVRLEYTDVIEPDGTAQFCFFVNDCPVFIRGTNWVPLDPMHSRDKEKLPLACRLLLESRCNAIRIWGGGVYEDDALYDFCDRHGILIWQDFMMGCATYPQTDEFATALFTEAAAVIRRLREHPSLALWAGDNECDQAAFSWGVFHTDPNLNRNTRQVLPEAVRRFDPARQFLPSSPYVSPRAFAQRARDLPEDHLWGPRDYYKGAYYTGAKALFASETGYHGCPHPSSIRRFISEKSLYPWEHNRAWLVHAACMEPEEGATYSYRIPLMANQVKTLFGEIPGDLASFSAASQISQAEAMKFFVDRFRGAKWAKTGIIWWNLLDGWPQFSDAVVDYYGAKKLAFHVLRNAQSPVYLLCAEPENGEIPLLLVNDSGSDAHVCYEIADADGGVLLTGEANTPANSPAMEIARIPDSGTQRCLLLHWTAHGEEMRSHYLTGRPTYDLQTVVRWMRAAGYDFEEI